ncbi:MAG: hypothetical protein AAB512_05170 [Patescibacteria group bacterium]
MAERSHTNSRQDFQNRYSVEPRIYRPVEQNSTAEAALAYNVRFDVGAYQDLHSQRASLQPQEFVRRLKNLNSLTETNVITSIGERLNVEIFKASYHLENGQLINNTYNEPFLEIIRNGQKFREEHGSQDVAREKAEVEMFTKVQEKLAGGELGPGAKVIVISPRGGIYGHNFYDQYQETTDGRITMSRFTSKDSYQDFHNASQILDPFNGIPDNPTDADFLRNPLVTYKSTEEIQTIFNPQEDTLSQDEFVKIIDSCLPYIQTYIRELVGGGNYKDAEALYFKILKLADVVSGHDPYITGQERAAFLESLSGGNHLRETQLATPLRPVATACGISGSPYSVASFGGANESVLWDKYESRVINCGTCGTSYIRPIGKLEPCCKFCGGTKGIVC